MSEPFTYPEEANEYWCPIIWCKDQTEDAAMGGWIIKPKRNSCDVQVCTTSGLRFKHDVIHADDPRVKEMPQEHQTMERGIFRVAPVELERRRLMARVGELTAAMGDIKARLELVEESLTAKRK